MNVTIDKYAELSGLTEHAIRSRIAKGVCSDGLEYHRDPLGRIMIDRVRGLSGE